MDIFLLSNLIITIALIIQLISLQNNNNFINPYSFLLLSLSTFIMAYAQYKYDNYKYNVPLKIMNGLIAIIIFIKVYC